MEIPKGARTVTLLTASSLECATLTTFDLSTGIIWQHLAELIRVHRSRSRFGAFFFVQFDMRKTVPLSSKTPVRLARALKNDVRTAATSQILENTCAQTSEVHSAHEATRCSHGCEFSWTESQEPPVC